MKMITNKFREERENMSESDKKLWKQYTDEIHNCYGSGNAHGMLFWSKAIDELFKKYDGSSASARFETFKEKLKEDEKCIP